MLSLHHNNIGAPELWFGIVDLMIFISSVKMRNMYIHGNTNQTSCFFFSLKRKLSEFLLQISTHFSGILTSVCKRNRFSVLCIMWGRKQRTEFSFDCVVLRPIHLTTSMLIFVHQKLVCSPLFTKLEQRRWFSMIFLNEVYCFAPCYHIPYVSNHIILSCIVHQN